MTKEEFIKLQSDHVKSGMTLKLYLQQLGTCKAAGVEPRLWMEDVLRRIPYYERDGKDMSDLLPREWVKRKE